MTNQGTIYFDMDGTLANFYGVENWLDFLMREDTTPYAIAKPLFNFSAFTRLLHKLQASGYRIGIVSWLSKCGSNSYNTKVTSVKMKWLDRHLPSVEWDEIKIVQYGTPKSTVVNDFGWLFDDEKQNREEWGENAFDVENILETLKKFLN
mgnify:CR=1 FL=1